MGDQAMSEATGTVTQKFRIAVDIDKLTEYIVDNILRQISEDKDISSVDLDEYIADGDTLEIFGTYDTDFKSYYSPATRWEPAEEDMQRFYIGEDGVGLLDTLPENIRKLIDIYNVEEEEDDADYKCDEPDEDAIYEEARDRIWDDD